MEVNNNSKDYEPSSPDYEPCFPGGDVPSHPTTHLGEDGILYKWDASLGAWMPQVSIFFFCLKLSLLYRLMMRC